MSLNLALPFYEQARRHPDRLALSVGDANLTYSQLAERAAQIAAWLTRRLEPAPGLVAVLASRSIEAYAAILGACWAGAAYVPLNPKTPEDRLITILEITAPDALVVDELGLKVLTPRLLDVCPERVLAPVCGGSVTLGQRGTHGATVSGPDHLPSAGKAPPPRAVTDDDLAYVIFTSGTTGVPKGVMISAGNVAHFLSAMQERYNLGPDDRVAQLSEITFDISVFDMFMTWGTGASLHVVPAPQVMGPSRFIQERLPSVWFSVPSTAALMRSMKMLRPGAFPSLRCSLFAGEPLPLSTAQAWRDAAPNSIVDNLYGPTEATVVCSVQRFSEDAPVTRDRGIIAIGRLFPRMEAAIVDPSLHFLPQGMEGELALCGDLVGKGYFKDAAQTAARFRAIDGRIWYFTGDRAYQDESGIFHHLGRIDLQVKILGHRVELEEVDAHLREVSGSAMVAAVTWPIVDGAARGLVAFVNAAAIPAPEIRERMKRRVPSYMVPARVVFLDALPVGATGKVDRKALMLLLDQERPGQASDSDR